MFMLGASNSCLRARLCQLVLCVSALLVQGTGCRGELPRFRKYCDIQNIFNCCSLCLAWVGEVVLGWVQVRLPVDVGLGLVRLLGALRSQTQVSVRVVRLKI